MRRLRDFLTTLPSQCRICRSWPASAVCDDCATRFATPRPRCRRCALPVSAAEAECPACRLHPPPLNQCLAACSYAWPWDDAIRRMKFQGEPEWAGPLARLLRSAPWVEPCVEQAHWLVPLPLAASRLRSRGFNQAHEIARRLCPRRTDARLLLRVRDTPAQSGLSLAQRRSNLAGAFALQPDRAAALRGRHVVLVDDVMTSGSSLHEAARVLQAAGAAQVSAIVVARTDAPGGD